MPTILVTESLNPVGIEILERRADVVFLDRSASEDAQRAQLVAADAIVSQIFPVDRELIAAASAGSLVAIAKHGVGVDNIDLEAASSFHVPVLFAPGANARSVAEHTLALALTVARRIPSLSESVRRGDYSVRRNLQLMELHDRTIAVIGAGATGRHVLDLCCRGLGMRGVAYDVVAPPAGSLPDGCRFTSSLEEALASADVVSVHLPLTPETAHLIGPRELATMRPGSILVNVGRGGVVDETALAASIADGHLLGAGVDVFEHEPPRPDNPLLALGDRVVLSPHSAGLSDRASQAIARTIADDIVRVLDGERPLHVANPAYAPLDSPA
jgi:D-3-phosphoglycerate dehydrogenase / 2-oxoglutarate reductase